MCGLRYFAAAFSAILIHKHLRATEASLLAGATEWEVAASHKFVNAVHSPSLLARALYIPWFSRQRNAYVSYVLLRRKQRKTRYSS